MQITQIVTGMNYTYTQNTYLESKEGKNNNQDTKQMDTVDISEEFKLNKVEFNEGKSVNIPQSSLKRAEMSIKLSQTMKFQGAGLSVNDSLENNLKDIAKAYDKIRSELNENSENSEKHVKFLNDAFENLVRTTSTQNAERLGMDVTGYAKNSIDGVNPFVQSAEKLAEIFSSTFLKEYKKNGMDALKTTMDKLNDMPETTSLFNISYNDFNILDTKRVQGRILTENVVSDLLKRDDLSDFMKDTISKSHENFKINGSSYGLNYIV